MNSWILNVIVGIILLTITIFVQKHTYFLGWDKERKEKVPFPLWNLLCYFLVAFIPVINIAVFGCGLVAYCLNYEDNEITFYYSSKWLDYILNFLNKEI